MPSLELSIACSENFRPAWITLVIVLRATGCCEVFDSIVVFSLVFLGDESDTGSCGDTVDHSFLCKVGY